VNDDELGINERLHRAVRGQGDNLPETKREGTGGGSMREAVAAYEKGRRQGMVTAKMPTQPATRAERVAAARAKRQAEDWERQKAAQIQRAEAAGDHIRADELRGGQS
jgi:hypothetical protein